MIDMHAFLTHWYRHQLKTPDWERLVEGDLAWTQRPNHHVLTLSDPRYPPLLKEISDPPPVLFCIGDPECLHRTQIAIVGSRNPTPTGREIAHELAASLARAGFCITSGLAIGIDGTAHHAALRAGGYTVAVLGNGLSTIYPRSHRHLAEQIANHGAVISEFPLESQAHAYHFPQRNRIISGLSRGTLVVEATRNSGSLITARCALEQNRDVFAVPGSIRNPLSSGCHELIRQGATLVACAEDLLSEWGIPQSQSSPKESWWREEEEPHRHPQAEPRRHHEAPGTGMAQGAKPKTRGRISRPRDAKTAQAEECRELLLFPPPHSLEADAEKLIECVGFETTSINQIIVRSGLTAQRVTALLLNLELHGYIKVVPSGYIRVRQ